VCVFPSRAEQGLPFAALEAIMCGVPIVVSKGNGASEDVMKMGCGVVADVNHPTALGEAIEIALKKNNFVNSGQKYIRANLAMEENVKKYEEVYRMSI
jgi:glycosyltransferase involved in cell wall biosynthesis